MNDNQRLEQIAENLTRANGETFTNTDNLNSSQLLEIIAIASQNLAENSGSIQSLPEPFISKIQPDTLTIGTDQLVEIEGSFFTPSTTAIVENSTISDLQFISSHKLSFRLNAGLVEGQFSVIIDNGTATSIDNGITLVDPSAQIVDFRKGGSDFSDNAIELAAGLSWTRHSWGITFSGSGSGWGKWALFPGDEDIWVKERSQDNPPKLILIIQAGKGMIGYGSREANPDSASQWSQQEIIAYFNTNTYFWGFYGNDGNIGSFENQSVGLTLETDVILKLEFNNFGEPESFFRIYQLPSSSEGWENQFTLSRREFIAANSPISDWLNQGQILIETQISPEMTADAAQIMPVIIPFSEQLNLLGFFYEE